MKLTIEQANRIKEIEIEIFKSFISVCEHLNLTYYILDGTLLGAVRHKGFIPWDDDIDVGMPREDYEVFLKEGQALLPEEYFIQTFDSDPEYLANYAKIRNSNTTFVETSVKNRKINHGVFIDVFPLDYCPEEAKKQVCERKKRMLATLRISDEFYSQNKKKSLKSIVVTLLAYIIYPTAKQALKARDRMYKITKQSSLIASYGGAWGEKEIVPAQWYAEGCDLEFEGIAVKGPKEYDKWLTQVYGDYMTPPPVEERISHHHIDFLDTAKSFKEYIDKSDKNE